MFSKTVANVSTREDAKKFVEKIQGKSYMNFQVNLCPAYGNIDVVVESMYDAPYGEILDMLIYLMFCEINNGYMGI
jgi:hypothetical protein